jgi:AcrR family transcriptional regulator
MARPKSEDKRNAILAATTELVAEQGLGAATAEVAKRAGIPQGSVFTYFSSKVELLNVLYLEVTKELTDTVLAAMPGGKDTRAQFRHLWTTWTDWGVTNPSKRRVQAQLNVSEVVSEQNRKAAYAYADPVFQLIRRVSAEGVLRNAPLEYVGALVDAWAATTMDFMIQRPAEADKLCRSGFDAVWLALSKR